MLGVNQVPTPSPSPSPLSDLVFGHSSEYWTAFSSIATAVGIIVALLGVLVAILFPVCQNLNRRNNLNKVVKLEILANLKTIFSILSYYEEYEKKKISSFSSQIISSTLANIHIDIWKEHRQSIAEISAKDYLNFSNLYFYFFSLTSFCQKYENDEVEDEESEKIKLSIISGIILGILGSFIGNKEYLSIFKENKKIVNTFLSIQKKNT